MEDPRDAVTRLYDTIDEMIIALVELKKVLEPLMDAFKMPTNKNEKRR